MKHGFLVGTHRSGTTWLGGLLSHGPSVAYWEEPRQVWTYRNWRGDSDRLDAADASPAVRRHIRRRFAGFAANRGKDYFVEKTPSNCFRVPFMHAVFPEGKFILLVRDGRGVIRSTDELVAKGPDANRIWSRLTESTVSELPAVAMRLPWLIQKAMGRPMKSWGVRPPGWRDWPDDLDPLQFAARQWAASINAAVAGFETLPEDQKIVVRHEDLVRNAETEMRRLTDFLQLPPSDADAVVSRAVDSADPATLQKWRRQWTDAELERIEPLARPTVESLGYDW